MKIKLFETNEILDTLSQLIYKAQEENHHAVENFLFAMSIDTIKSIANGLNYQYQHIITIHGDLQPSTLGTKEAELEEVNIPTCYRIIGHVVYLDNRLPYGEVGIISVVFK